MGLNKRKRKNIYYVTHQIDLKSGDQLRLTFGKRTMFVYCNGRGLNIRKGGYTSARSSTG